MARVPKYNDRVNLEHITVLLIDDNPQALDILSSVMQGFGVREQIRCASALEATLWGTWLHAEAGRILTERVGRVGFLAREIPDLIPGLLPD